MTDKPAFQRVLVKLSGEALMGDLEFGTDPGTVEAIARQLKRVHDRDLHIALPQPLDLPGDLTDDLGIGPVFEVAHQGLARDLEQDPLERGLGHATRRPRSGRTAG